MKKMRLIEELIDDILSSQNKESAKESLMRLEAVARDLSTILPAYGQEKFRQLIAKARAASGVSRDKEHFMRLTDLSLKLLRREILSLKIVSL